MCHAGAFSKVVQAHARTHEEKTVTCATYFFVLLFFVLQFNYKFEFRIFVDSPITQTGTTLVFWTKNKTPFQPLIYTCQTLDTVAAW